MTGLEIVGALALYTALVAVIAYGGAGITAFLTRGQGLEGLGAMVAWVMCVLVAGIAGAFFLAGYLLK